MKRGRKSRAERDITAWNAKRSGRDRQPFLHHPPAPPDHLSPSTKAWWDEITEAFDIEPHNLRTLVAAAEAWDRKEEARKALAEHGLSYEDSKGMVRARPEVAVERDSRVAYLRAIRELGFDDAAPPASNGIEPPVLRGHYRG